jgi:hypothetical protein
MICTLQVNKDYPNCLVREGQLILTKLDCPNGWARDDSFCEKTGNLCICKKEAGEAVDRFASTDCISFVYNLNKEGEDITFALDGKETFLTSGMGCKLTKTAHVGPGENMSLTGTISPSGEMYEIRGPYFSGEYGKEWGGGYGTDLGILEFMRDEMKRGKKHVELRLFYVNQGELRLKYLRLTGGRAFVSYHPNSQQQFWDIRRKNPATNTYEDLTHLQRGGAIFVTGFCQKADSSPAPPPAQPSICAQNAGSKEEYCSCQGTVSYGRKWKADSIPSCALGDEATCPLTDFTTFEELKAQGHAIKKVAGSIKCNIAEMGGGVDPLPHKSKYCYCKPAKTSHNPENDCIIHDDVGVRTGRPYHPSVRMVGSSKGDGDFSTLVDISNCVIEGCGANPSDASLMRNPGKNHGYHPCAKEGGAMFVRGRATVNIANSVFRANTVATDQAEGGYGGAISTEAGDGGPDSDDGDNVKFRPEINIWSTNFTKNKAKAKPGDTGGYGGALYLDGSIVHFRDAYTFFWDNLADNAKGNQIYMKDAHRVYFHECQPGYTYFGPMSAGTEEHACGSKSRPFYIDHPIYYDAWPQNTGVEF